MSEQCRNGSCARLGNRMVRLDGVGDRLFCDPCIAIFRELGVGMRVLDETPEQRPEWMKRNLARDFTRSVA
jgi:hypothetical protein